MIVVVAAAIVNIVVYLMILREKNNWKNMEKAMDSRIELGKAIERGIDSNVEALRKQTEFFQIAVAHYESVRRQAEGERIN